MSEMLEKKNWLVIGDVLNTSKAAFSIVNKLVLHQKTVHSMNPRITDDELKNIKATNPNIHNSWATMQGIPIDVVDLCINPGAGIGLLHHARSAGIKNIFIQPGAGSPEIEEFCTANGMTFHNGCVLREL